MTSKALLLSLDELDDIQAAEKKLMVSSCTVALFAILLAAASLLRSGAWIVVGADLVGAVILTLQLVWIWRRDRFLLESIWVLSLMAVIILMAVHFNGAMSVYWLYPTIVYSYFWLDVRRAIIFSVAYTLLVSITVSLVEGFNLLLQLRLLSAALVTGVLLYYFALVRDNYIAKLARGNSAYRSYTDVLNGKVQSQYEEIRESEEKFRGITDTAHDAVLMVNDAGLLTYWNPAAERMFGYRRDEVLGQEFLQMLVPAGQRAAVRKDFERDFAAFRSATGSLASGRSFEVVAMHKDGHEIPVSVSISPLRLRQRWHSVAILRDMTEHRIAEATRRQLAAIVKSTAVSIVGEDLDGMVTSWNLGAQNVYGYTAEEMIGRSVAVLIPEDRWAEFETCAAKIKRGEEVPRFDTVRRRKDGQLIDISLAFSPIRNEHGELAGISAVGHDITAIKRAERELRHVNRALQTRSSCDLALVHADNEIGLIGDMCRVLVEVGGYRGAWVGFVEDDAEKTVQPMAHHGQAAADLGGLHFTWADTAQGGSPWGRAVRTGEGQVFRYADDAPAALPWDDRPAVRSGQAILALPLRHDGGRLGVLTLHAAGQEDAFDAEEMTLNMELADDLAYGIVALRTRAAHDSSMERLQHSMESTITAVARMVEMRDPYTTGHQQRVAELAVAIGRAMGLSEQRVYGLHLAGIVHDLGKMRIPAEILSKPGELTRIEYEMIKTHPEAGYEILKNVDFLWPIAQTVLQHHERFDGSGYPAGLKGEQILLEARIIAVADAVEAIASHRPYRPARGIDAALKELTDHRGQLYDPAVVDVCVRLFEQKQFSFGAPVRNA